MKDISLALFQNKELLSILMVCAVISAAIILFFRFIPEKMNHSRISRHKDLLNVSLITACYAVVSLWRLGTPVFFRTTWQPQKAGQQIIFELPGETHFDAVYSIYCEGDNNSNPATYQLSMEGMILEGSDDLEQWSQITVFPQKGIYQYLITSGDWDYHYVRLRCPDKNGTLSEIGFRAYGGSVFLPVRVYEDEYADSVYPASLVIDEQSVLTIEPSWYDESYFDEVYHPRNAWEIANGQYMYASVHPLLGTCIIALFIRLFGFSPLVYRLPGALFGIMLLPLFHAVLKQIFRNSSYAFLGTLFLACDFMHLTTSRIATLEPFSVFWILLMYYWMIRYYKSSFYKDFKGSLKLLLYCGIAMGLGIATKWTACYSAVGLAILLFTNLFHRFSEYRHAVKALKDNPEEQDSSLLYIRNVFPRYFFQTIGWCFLFFIGIPLLIYFVSYIPTKVWRDGWSVRNVIRQIVYMYKYHINLTATHPYQSMWYQWLLDARPIWYFGRATRDGFYNSIACFSNPLLCWAGLPSFLLVVYDAVVHRNKNAWIILTGYLTAFLPWVTLVERCVFAYHFYPTSFFMIMAVVYAGRRLVKLNQNFAWVVTAFAMAVVIVFVIFLPVTAGFTTTTAYIKLLEWLPGWWFG